MDCQESSRTWTITNSALQLPQLTLCNTKAWHAWCVLLLSATTARFMFHLCMYILKAPWQDLNVGYNSVIILTNQLTIDTGGTFDDSKWRFEIQILSLKLIIQKCILIQKISKNNLYWDPTSDIETINICLSRFWIYSLRDIRVTLCLWYFNTYICISL